MLATAYSAVILYGVPRRFVAGSSRRRLIDDCAAQCAVIRLGFDLAGECAELLAALRPPVAHFQNFGIESSGCFLLRGLSKQPVLLSLGTKSRSSGISIELAIGQFDGA
jgi:hypothetical protein